MRPNRCVRIVACIGGGGSLVRCIWGWFAFGVRLIRSGGLIVVVVSHYAGGDCSSFRLV